MGGAVEVIPVFSAPNRSCRQHPHPLPAATAECCALRALTTELVAGLCRIGEHVTVLTARSAFFIFIFFKIIFYRNIFSVS